MFVGVLALYAWSERQGAARGLGREKLFYIGWALGFLALVSPLCMLSVALFSARVAQHMFLAAVVAPLIAASHPWEVLTRTWPPRRAPVARAAVPAWFAALAFAVVLWFWHAPGPYAATFRSDAVYWSMHLSTFAAALWLWSTLLGRARRMVDTAAALAITSLQMAVLGAIITFAPRALYAPHALTTWPWGLSPLADQQLGGAIMWVPAGVIIALATILPLAVLLRDPPARPRMT